MVDFNFKSFYVSAVQPWTILDKTVEQIVYLDSIFLNIVAVPVLLSPPSPESNVVVYSKESLIPGRLWEATLNWGKGFSFRKGVVLEIVSLRRKVDMMGKLSQVVLSGIVALIAVNVRLCQTAARDSKASFHVQLTNWTTETS